MNGGYGAEAALSRLLALERYFGAEALGWLNLQQTYDLRVAEIANKHLIDM